MTLSIRLRAALASIKSSTGMVSRKLARYAALDFPILMYHRVLPFTDTETYVQAGMVVEPDTLDCHIRYLKKKFDIVPLAELPGLCANNGNQPSKDHLCALTFDDGWCDFYENAFPVLENHNAPATVFLPTGYIDTKRWFWTDRFGFLLRRVMKLNSDNSRQAIFEEARLNRILNTHGGYYVKLEKGIGLLKTCKIKEIEQILVRMAEHTGGQPAPSGRAFLTWEEVREMARSGLISFGSHTDSHPILTTVEEQAVRRELIASKDILLSHGVADPSFIAFSYPNGDYNDRLKQIVKDVGYHVAVSTQGGWNRMGEDRFALRRIAIHQDMTSSEAMFVACIANVI